MMNVKDLSSGVVKPYFNQASGQDKTTDNARHEPTAPAGGTERLSPLARQLSDAALRADTRETTLNNAALADKAKTLLGQITGDGYFANRAAHDSEVPASDDPAAQARAKQATAFNAGRAENPFKGLSREQLAIVAYDDSGTFTVNERRAAWSEAADREFAWRQKAVAQAMQEWNDTGKQTDFFKSVLAHFQELPKIEQVQYGEHYADGLQKRIDEGKTDAQPVTLDALMAPLPV